MRIDKKQNGRNLIAWIVLTPFALILIAVFLCEANKAYWDYRVTKMCEEDGGVEIFEHIEVTAEEIEKMPRIGLYIGIRAKKAASSAGDIVYSEYESIDLPMRPILGFNLSLYRVWKSKIFIKRSSDEKTIAQITSYSRFGGDFPSLFHSSSFSCPLADKNRLEREKIFIIKEK